MKKENLKIGVIDENDFLNLFATPSQKKKYYDNNKFTGTMKNTVIKEANRYCEIIYIGDRKYDIKSIYDFPLPKSMTKMTSSLYQYIIPLILIKLVEGHDEYNKINLTCSKWARQIDMVNSNYNFVKYNKNSVGKYFDFKDNQIEDFYSKADDMITNYLQNALKYLKESGSVIWREVYMVHQEILGDKIIEVDEKNNAYAELTLNEHQATEDEMKFYAGCINIADKAANISNASERYYGKKAPIFSKRLSSELLKKNIKYIYKTYEVYYISLDKCKFLLSKFNIGNDKQNRQEFINAFNQEFETMIMDNANKRYIKNLEKYSSDYIDSFYNLCDMTIKNETESIVGRISPDLNDEDRYNYNLKLKIKREVK